MDFLDMPQNIAISLGRGNGKTSFLGGLGAAAVIGPLAVRRGDWNCIASSHNQASILFEHAVAAIEEKGFNPYDRKTFRLIESSGKTLVQKRDTRARLRCVGSDPKRAHGMAGSFILDEPAQWPHHTSQRMINAAETGLGKIPGAKILAIGTRPADPEHWFSKMLNNPLVNSIVYSAPEKAVKERPYDEETIRMANPSWDHLPSLREAILLEAEKAKSDPDIAASFRSLRLNAGTPETNSPMLIGADNWRRIESYGPGATTSPSNVWGVDLASGGAMCSVASWNATSGLLRAIACWPLIPSIEERQTADSAGTDYERMVAEGSLRQYGEYSVDFEQFFGWALEEFGKPNAIVADSWKQDQLKQGLSDANVPFCPLITRRNGPKDGSEDVSDFRKACADGWVRPEKKTLLRSAMSSARVAEDASGNARLAKLSEAGRRARSRDDAAAASILCVAVGYREAVRIGLPRPSGLDEGSFLDAA